MFFFSQILLPCAGLHVWTVCRLACCPVYIITAVSVPAKGTFVCNWHELELLTQLPHSKHNGLFIFEVFLALSKSFA